MTFRKKFSTEQLLLKLFWIFSMVHIRAAYNLEDEFIHKKKVFKKKREIFGAS